jgi:hypothetical protein
LHRSRHNDRVSEPNFPDRHDLLVLLFARR